MPRRLTPVDSAFLLAERRHQPFHVGALCVYDPPEGEGRDVAFGIAERLRESQAALPPFNHRLRGRPGLGTWEEAEDFDLAQHFVHLSLPRPGRIRELLAMVSRVHSAHLDRAYPLWRMYLIEGLDDGRIATFSKIHHAMVDGIAGIRLMLRSMSGDSDASIALPPPWELQPRQRQRNRAPEPPQATDLLQMAQSLRRATPHCLAQLRRTIADYRLHHPDAVHSLQAPLSPLNTSISGSRRFSAQSYSTARIKRLAQTYDATKNDVVLALCGSALRRYLQDLNALPDRPLIAGVPVSVRTDDSDSGNEITFALANLGTHLADPAKRLLAVKGSMDYHKQMYQGMSRAQVMAYSLALLAPGAMTLLPGLNRRHTPMNVIISHVPGPRQDIFWQGCRLDGIYPASIVLDGFALNITLISRGDAIDFGITACRQSLPQTQRLLDYIDDAILELETAAGLPAADREPGVLRLEPAA